MALLTELAVDTLDLSDNKRLDDGSMQVGGRAQCSGVCSTSCAFACCWKAAQIGPGLCAPALPASSLPTSFFSPWRLRTHGLQALSHAPRLRSLAINCCPKVSDRGLLALTRCAPLRHLSADRCPQLSSTALVALQHRLPLLRVARPAGGRGLLAQPQLEY